MLDDTYVLSELCERVDIKTLVNGAYVEVVEMLASALALGEAFELYGFGESE